MREEARKQHLRKVALTQIWDINMDEIKALASKQEPAISAPGPSPVSITAGKGAYRRLFDYDSKSELSIRVDSFADLVTVPRCSRWNLGESI